MQTPECIKDKIDELTELCKANPNKIPLIDVAKFLNMDVGCLKASIEQGKCPFGLSWKAGVNRGFAINTMQFYMAMLGRFDYKLKVVDV